IRKNILCNPTSKKGHFRAIDWIVEHNNLYIKRIYGGKFSNHQIERILAESPLIEVYKNTRLQFEKMFCLEHKTTRHSPPAMEMTFKKLGKYMQQEKLNEFIAGRKSKYSIPDSMENGMDKLMKSQLWDIVEEEVAENNIGDIEPVDLDNDYEIEDDGSLDIY
ncbi:hypothetical protein BDQ17DRAFT_1254437, partial [Cyathus striatus]